MFILFLADSTYFSNICAEMLTDIAHGPTVYKGARKKKEVLLLKSLASSYLL